MRLIEYDLAAVRYRDPAFARQILSSARLTYGLVGGAARASWFGARSLERGLRSPVSESGFFLEPAPKVWFQTPAI